MIKKSNLEGITQMKRKSILLIHFFFWFYIVNQALFPLYIGQIDASYMIGNKYLKDVAINTLLNMLSFYLIYGAFPIFFGMKCRVVAIAAGLVFLVLITAIRAPLEFFSWKLFGNLPREELLFKWMYLWNNLRMVIIMVIYAILIRFMINAFESQKLKDELINQRQAGELALLRSQVNPHFLFNTLNNIYSLVYKKSEAAPAAVMKLSSIMRYMLYDSNAEKVPLEKEIEYLKSFIELQNLRTKYPDFVSLEILGDTDGHFIAPMLLISFVENAFKHGSKAPRPGIIIKLGTVRGKIQFEVVNYQKKKNIASNENKSGNGLESITRRLELIYPGKHMLFVSDDTETFRINLEIEN